MKIAVNALNLAGNLAGIGYYTKRLYLALAALDEVEEIRIFTNAKAAAALEISHPKITVRGYDLPGIFFKTMFAQLIFPLMTRGFDQVHSVGNVAAVFCRKPQVVTVHDLCHKALGDRFGLAKRLYLEAGFFLSLRMKNIRFVCDTFSTENDFVRFYPSSRGRMSTVHLACKFEPSGDAGGRKDLLFVGTLEPGKNLVLALEALQILKTGNGLQPRLNIVGARGWKQSSLPQVIEALGIGDQLTFMGRISDDELLHLYRQSAALVYPSLYEGFGFPILEAQSQGCPVISATNSCLPEIAGEGAVYFADNNPRALAESIEKTLGDGDFAGGLRNRGYENNARFSWEKTARETLRVFRATNSGR